MRLYLSYENRVIPNYFMVRVNDVDETGDGQNDGIWCPSGLNKSMKGAWYLPNGSPVLTQSCGSPFQSYNTNVIGQMGLLRRDWLASVEGLYSCIIPNEDRANQTLYVAAYRYVSFESNSKLIIYLCIYVVQS